jgi:hypothetical protein
MSSNFIIRRGLQVTQGISAASVTASAMSVSSIIGTASLATKAESVGPLNQDVDLTGSLNMFGNLTVIGTASFTYTTASQTLLNQNTISTFATSPASPKGGYKVVDSASQSVSSSFLYDIDEQKWTLDKPLVVSGSVNISGSFLINGEPLPKGGASVTISGSVPSGSKESGSLWWNETDGNLYVQITTPTGSTYVPAVNTVAGGNYGETRVASATGSVWTINHNLATFTPLVTVYSGSSVMIPASITSLDANNTRITFSGSVTGTVILSTGIGNATTNNAISSSFATSALSAISSSFATSASVATSASFARSASFATTASSAQNITGTTGSGLWVWSMGTPTNHGWTFFGDASYSSSAASGIILTPNDDFRNGSAYRNAATGYFTTEEFILSANMISGGGTGADGIALFAGSNNFTGGNYQGITIFFDEYNGDGVSGDALKIYKNSALLALIPVANYVASGSVLDSNRVRKAEMIVEGPQAGRWLTVTLDDKIIYRASIGAWTPDGTLYGVWGFNGGAYGLHAVPAIGLRPAKMWKMYQGLI